MTHFARPPRPLLAVAGAASALLGCDFGGHAGEEHGEIERIELEARTPSAPVLAVWTAEAGWEDAGGEPLAELPAAAYDGDALVPLRAGGDPASVTVRFFDHDGREFELDTISRDEATGERECTEDSVRYFPLDDATDVIAWPPIAHPESPDGPSQFAELGSGDVTGIFHCDHVDIYPETEGTADLEFVLWHKGHGDDATDALTVRVEAAE